MAAALNVALGNLGNTVDYGAPLTSDETAGPLGLGALAEEVASGNVDTLVITASNPVYGAPIDFKLGKLLERVPNTIYHDALRGRDGGRLQDHRPRGASARVVGRSARHRRHRVDRAAADRAALGRRPGSRRARGVPRRGRCRRARAAAPVLEDAGQGARRLRRQLGALAGRRHRAGHRARRSRPG